MSTSMTIALTVLGYFTAYMVFERVIFHIWRREADELELNEVTATWKSSRQIQPLMRRMRLGWLNRLLAQANGNVTIAWRLCNSERLQIERYEVVLPMLGSLGTVMGLLGTFCALAANAVGSADPTHVLALGIRSSIFGICIAIPATVCDGMFRQRVSRLRFQCDVVLEALEELLTPPPEFGTGMAAPLSPVTGPAPQHALPSADHRRANGSHSNPVEKRKLLTAAANSDECSAPPDQEVYP